tara:strand:+ start:149 stop:580 length:432 start_codon:yes stop_codon:yes gene_type:complete
MIDLDSQLTEEEFNLYNPAYCGYLLYSFIKSHKSHSEQAIHCGLIYLILPIVLTKEILVKLPRSSKSSFISWVSDNEGALIGFPQRTQSFLEISLSAQDFLIENELIYITEDGFIGVSDSTLPKSSSLFNGYPEFLVDKMPKM